MKLKNIDGYTLSNLNKINVVLGKNGCGKSTMLRQLEKSLRQQYQDHSKSGYITPERGGVLEYDENALYNANLGNMSYDRRKNLLSNFRQQSAILYNKLELSILREFEKDQSKEKFDWYIDRINSLLDNIEIRRKGSAFKFFKKGTSDELKATEISSGESELTTLAIELLIFLKELEKKKDNFLFLDEPDVHLHPDLQARLMDYLEELVRDCDNFKIILATHSTAILGALEPYGITHFAFMTFGQKTIEFNPISKTSQKILPVFGAHPLSNVFSKTPILLIEGGDDERIWQQVVRSSNGKVCIHPCSVEGINNINEFEREAQKIIETIYDNAKGYSLRDRDGTKGEINNLNSIVRMKLSCRASENLLLSDEVLRSLEQTWDYLQEQINHWLEAHKDHPHHKTMNKFKKQGYKRKSFDLKEIRNDLMGIIGSEKPWEVAVGQTIATMTWNDNTDFNEDGKLLSFLGEKIVRTLLPNNKD